MEDIFGQYKDILRRKPSLTKAKALLGYEPKISMEMAIKKMIESRKMEACTGT
jgi:nucleoside-diphosphate-sugar epimerase